MKTLKEIHEAKSRKVANGFCILKPGFTRFSEEFLNVLNTNGWDVLHKGLRKLTRDEVERLYQNKKDEPYYQTLCDYMICDDCLCCSCYKKCDDPIADMKALKKKIREQWGEDDIKDAMHSAESADDVVRECGICLSECCKTNESKSADEKEVQAQIDAIPTNANDEINKLTVDGVKSIIRNNTFGVTKTDVGPAVDVKEKDGCFIVKFDCNDFLTYNRISKLIPAYAKFFKHSEGAPKVEVDSNRCIMKIYKKDPVEEALQKDLAIDEDNSEIVDALVCALAEEFNAWYQYTIAAPFIKGKKRKQTEDFYKEAANDELTDHAYSILERLNVLGADTKIADGMLKVDGWDGNAKHKFIVPDHEFDSITSLKQNIEAEKGAIETYTDLVNASEGKDIVTCELAKRILEDEQKHLQELEEILQEAES